MRSYELRILAMPVDGKGRPTGAPRRALNERVWAEDLDLARSAARELVAERGKNLISISVTGKTALVAYVKA